MKLTVLLLAFTPFQVDSTARAKLRHRLTVWRCASWVSCQAAPARDDFVKPFIVRFLLSVELSYLLLDRSDCYLPHTISQLLTLLPPRLRPSASVCFNGFYGRSCRQQNSTQRR